MKNILFLFTLIFTTTLSSQERIGYFENILKENKSVVREIIPVINNKNSDVVFFIADAKNVYGYKLNGKFDVTAKITSEEKRRKFKTLLGYSISNNDNYKIILTNKTENKFLIVDFSFSKKDSSTKEFLLNDPEEKLIQTISINNNFYLITLKPYTGNYYNQNGELKEISYDDDILNFYLIDSENNLIKKEIDLSKYTFLSKKGDRIKAKSLLSPKFKKNKIPKIDATIPNSIDITSETTKLYIQDNSVLFSFDENNEFTQVLKIDLNNFTAKKDDYKKNILEAKRSNSFINGDTIFVVSSNKKDLSLEIINTQSKKVLKKLAINEDKNIAFKNSPLIQKGGMYDDYRELKTSKQFLRKITKDKFGISIYKSNNKYQISIGGYIPKPTPNFGGMAIGSIGAISIFFNPTMFAYNASTETTSTEINCLFNSKFEHVKGEIPENTFDKIEAVLNGSKNWDIKNAEYLKATKKTLRDDNDITEVFKINNQIILGSYDRSAKMYHFYKF